MECMCWKVKKSCKQGLVTGSELYCLRLSNSSIRNYEAAVLEDGSRTEAM